MDPVRHDQQLVAARAADRLADAIAGLEIAANGWTPLPHQIPPPGDWYGWLLMAGRMAGKTDACAAYVVDHVHGPPCMPGPIPHWIAIIGPTLGDASRACYSGPSGIRAHDPSATKVSRDGGTIVYWPNGSEAKLFGAHSEEDTDRLRAGGNNCLVWADEIAAWRYLDAAWAQMRFGLRIGPRPRWVGSTTPRPRPLIKRMDAGQARNTVVTHAPSSANPHIVGEVLEALFETYGGTALAAQELEGRIVDQDENALWKREQIELTRLDPNDLPGTTKISVGVDPSGGAGEQGIVVAAKTPLWVPPNLAQLQGLEMPVDKSTMQPLVSYTAKSVHHGIVLDDRTCHLHPDGWGRRAVQAAVDWSADDIVVETNYGKDMAIATITSAAEAMGIPIPVRVVTATRGKRVRAEPVSALTAQARWHMAGVFEALEDQLCTWTPELDWSPDRLDAMVWVPWHHKLVHTSVQGLASMGRSGGALGKSLNPGLNRSGVA
jgi:phage terminase large subunit-like protein